MHRRAFLRLGLGGGLAVRGEQARSAGADVDAWLRRTGLLDGR